MSVVAIVGRPNVGKSALFNKIVGRRKALVSDLPGLTRDRHYSQADWCGVSFTMIDTGGLSFDETVSVEAKVHDQSMEALNEADVIICLFDARDGVTNVDRDIVRIFRKSGKKAVYAVNKIDSEKNDGLVVEFGELGVDLVAISAEHSRNIDELLDKVIAFLPPSEVKPEESGGVRIALVGRPNVGKSTIINQLCQKERVVTHEIPGTTRDTIDVEVKYEGDDYIFVDTAGIKKKAKTMDKVDKFATLKSLRAVEDANIVFVVTDATEGVTRQDISLAAHSFNAFKPTALLVNKWDLSKVGESPYIKDLKHDLKELREIPILCISGKTGCNCRQIFKVAGDLQNTSGRRVPTSMLNRFFEELKESHPVPDWKGKQVSLKYITQVESSPPVFVVFTNQPEGVADSYRRFLINGLRRILGGPQVPIVLKLRSK